MILLSHLLSAWLPALALGTADRRVPYLVPFAHTPLAILWSGDTAVMVFFVLSGLVLARSSFGSTGPGEMTARVLKRTTRLLVSAGAAIWLTGALVWADAMHNQEAAAVSRSPWLAQFYLPGPRPGLLWSALGGSVITGSDWWIGPLWSTHVQLFGSMLIFGLIAVLGSDRRATVAVGVVIAWSLLAGSSRFGLHFASIASGMMMHLLMLRASQRADRRSRWSLGTRRLWTYFTLAVAFYFGSWPDEAEVGAWYNPVARMLGFTDNYLRPRAVAHTLSAALIVWVALHHRTAQSLLSCSFLRATGRLSFCIYLTHWAVLMSVGSWVFARVSLAAESVYLGAFLASIATVAGTIVVAMVFRSVVDRPSQRLAEWVGDRWVPADLLQPRRAHVMVSETRA